MSLRQVMEDNPAPRESYWQLGCMDARAGIPPNPPAHRLYPGGTVAFFQPERCGYFNGYDYGKKSPNVLAKYQRSEA